MFKELDFDTICASLDTSYSLDDDMYEPDDSDLYGFEQDENIERDEDYSLD